MRQGKKKYQDAKNQNTKFFIFQLVFAINDNHNYNRKETILGICLITKEISNQRNQTYKSCRLGSFS